MEFPQDSFDHLKKKYKKSINTRKILQFNPKVPLV